MWAVFLCPVVCHPVVSWTPVLRGPRTNSGRPYVPPGRSVCTVGCFTDGHGRAALAACSRGWGLRGSGRGHRPRRACGSTAAPLRKEVWGETLAKLHPLTLRVGRQSNLCYAKVVSSQSPMWATVNRIAPTCTCASAACSSVNMMKVFSQVRSSRSFSG